MLGFFVIFTNNKINIKSIDRSKYKKKKIKININNMININNVANNLMNTSQFNIKDLTRYVNPTVQIIQYTTINNLYCYTQNWLKNVQK